MGKLIDFCFAFVLLGAGFCLFAMAINVLIRGHM
jgi:hypothetical protein